MTSPKRERRRRWAPKARTGCGTCKIRRKKCDEVKPHCHRCVKDKYTCDGYISPKIRVGNLQERSSSQPDASTLVQSKPQPCSTVLPRKPSSRRDFSSDKDPHALDTRSTFYTTVPLREPSNPWSQDLDQRCAWDFFLTVVPLFSTTRLWRFFWQYTVPQVAWQYASIRHAMVALAVACNSSISPSDRTELLVLKSNLSIREFTAEPVTSDIALILCRLLTCISQCTGEWATAAIHVRNGRKILKEACHDGPYQTDMVKLMAPTLLSVSSDVGEDHEIVEKMSPNKRQSFISLKFIRKEYGRLLTSLHEADWPRVDGDTNAILLLGWSALTNAINSVAFPGVLKYSTQEPLTPVSQVRATLLGAGSFMALDQLVDFSLSLFRHINNYYLVPNFKNQTGPENWRSHLRLCVDNCVTHAAEIEPRITAGTFWHAENPSHCTVESHLGRMGRIKDKKLLELQDPDPGRPQRLMDDLGDDRRGYYLEHVCPYRSGFTPAFV
ncbi:uncharacterized protein A1O9_02631 [Exophiala aquamarina CBS 119918]|uniref:Zn(2)-C6 fungal-type domain-containing protein n=1 Tax=Exophiala aquamarina CBS 119918 TaxID=1182545 RepID=A0A072PMG1_9EURO|nr:uncharacterized protein A1O9_02631 [Exophiala aquamarina CBS 119918]KEF61066.1 hypothetical protein A1O9_02631 [Exophiala aquamarina CBS 119918]